MAGRPTKLTAKVQADIVQAVADGNYFSVACEMAGVPIDTGYQWLSRGRGAVKNRKPTAQFVQFAQAIKKAEAQAESVSVGRIRKAAKEGNWQADAWYLERKFPERWARRERAPIDIPYDDLTDEQLERIAAGEDPLIVLATAGKSQVEAETEATSQEGYVN